jgi:phage baseplate assembly protein W
MADYGLVFYDRPDFNFAEDSDRFIIENVKRILMTRQGERINNPTFGSNLKTYLFQPEMLMDDIAHEIVLSLGKWEPRAEVRNIEVTMANEKVVIKLTIRNKTNQNVLTTSFNATG